MSEALLFDIDELDSIDTLKNKRTFLIKKIEG